MLVVVLVLAALLRILWIDSLPAVVTNHEAQIAVHARHDPLAAWYDGEELVSPVPWLLTIISIKSFGFSPFALRFPIIVFSIAAIYFLYRVARHYFGGKAALIAAGLLAVSPWHIHLSRFFIEEVILVTMMLAAILAYQLRRTLFLIASLIGVALSSWHFIGRFSTALVENIPWWFMNLFTYLSFDWLFFRGDKYFLHGVGDLGQFYTILIPFFLVGLFACWDKNAGRVVLSAAFIMIALASLSKFSPEARAALPTLPFLIMIIGLGLERSIQWVQKLTQRWSIFVLLLVVGIFLYQFISYLHFYMVHFGKRSGSEWSAVYKQVAPYIVEQYGTHDAIIVSNHYGAAREQLVFHAPNGSVLRERSASKISYGVPDKLDTVPPGTLLFLEPEFNLKNAHRVREFKLVNNVPALIAWEIQ